MVFNTLRSKLSFATSITAVLVFGIVITYSVITGRNKAIKAAKIEYNEKAKRLAILLKVEIDNSFSKLESQNITLKTLNRNGKLNKSTALELIKSKLLKNKDYVGMCAMFEPNKLCENDTSYSHLMDKDIFIPYLYYNLEGEINIDPLMDYDVEGMCDYYLIPKQSKKPLLTEPYSYPINGKDILMVTLSEPILQDSLFLGVTTIDYDIHFIQQFCKDVAKEVNNGHSNVAVMSNGGIIVASSADSSLIGKDISNIYSQNVQYQLQSIKEGKEEIHIQNRYLILEIPVLFSETETPWRVHVAVPRYDIYAAARQQTWMLIIIGLVFILLAVTLINVLTKKLTKPLSKLVDNTKQIAAGDLHVNIKAIQKDEVGILATSFNIMVIRLREMIEALQKSVKEIRQKNIELADKEEKFRKLFEEASDAILLLHKDGTIFDCNQSACDYFKMPKETLLRKTVIELSPEYQAGKILSWERAQELIDKTLHNKVQRFEWENIDGEGHTFTVSVSLNKIDLSGISYVQAILKDITKKKQKDKELQQLRRNLEIQVKSRTKGLQELLQKHRMILDSSPLAISLIRNRKIISAKGNLFNMFGYKEAELINKSTSILYSSMDDYEDFGNKLYPALETGGAYSGEYVLKKKNGNPFWCRIIGKAINPKDLSEGIIVLSQDISEEKEAREKLKKALFDLKELNATKDKFFRIIGHDLKNPMGQIVQFSHLLEEDYSNFSEEQIKKYVSILKDSSDRSFKLLENLLDWAQSQTNSISFNPEKLNIHDLVNENFELLEKNAGHKGILLKNNVSASCEAYADRNMIKTVLRNLISNAIKFTYENGEVTVSQSSVNASIQLCVQDNGKGMTAKECEILFKIDSGFSTAGTNNERGTGIGLILCKEFIDKHDGDIWVESEINKGSQFYFTLPEK